MWCRSRALYAMHRWPEWRAARRCRFATSARKMPFRLTPEDLREAITPRTKVLILPYPNNPTGGV